MMLVLEAEGGIAAQNTRAILEPIDQHPEEMHAFLRIKQGVKTDKCDHCNTYIQICIHLP